MSQRTVDFIGGAESFAVAVVAYWGAVKFGGGWMFAYGAASAAALVLSIAFLRRAVVQPGEEQQ